MKMKFILLNISSTPSLIPPFYFSLPFVRPYFSTINPIFLLCVFSFHSGDVSKRVRLCVVTWCRIMVVYLFFGRPCCLHLQGDGDVGSMILWNVGIPWQPRRLRLGELHYTESLLICLLTHSMEQNIIWRAHCRSAYQKYPAYFMEPEGLSPCSQKAATEPYPELAESNSPHRFLSH